MFPSPTANKLKFPAVNQNSKTKCTKNSKTICFYFQLHGIYPTLDDPIKIRYDSSKLPGLSKVLTINKSLLFCVSRANLCVQSKQTLEASRLTIILFHINSITTLTPLPLYIHPYLTLCKSSSFFLLVEVHCYVGILRFSYIMSNIPRSLTDSSLTLFNLAISASDPWPFSLAFL